MNRWEIQIEYGACMPTELLLWADVLANGTVGKPGWFEDPTVQTWARRVSAGGKPLIGPMLVIAGDGDTAVPVEFVQSAFNASSASAANSAQSLEMAVYQGLDHFPTVDMAEARWLDWIKARFDGEVVIRKRTSTFVRGPRIAGARTSPLPNWLVQFVGSGESWKLSL